jgi:hypothetical protein
MQENLLVYVADCAYKKEEREMGENAGTARFGLALLALGFLTALATPALAVAPNKQHYAGVLILRDPETGELTDQRICARFTKGEWCTENDDCGSWEFLAKQGPRNAWRATIEIEFEDGDVLDATLYGLTERTGPRSSIGGTFVFALDGVTLNAALAGTQTSRSSCLEFALSDDE